MGFSQDSYARIWYSDNKGRYSVANVTISKKDKATGTYTVDFGYQYVRLVGEAHNKVQALNLPTREEFDTSVHKGVTIRIKRCDLSNKADAEAKKIYWNPVIYDFEIPDRNNANQTSGTTKAEKTKKPVANTSTPQEFEDDDDLPF